MGTRRHPLTYGAIGFFAALVIFSACELLNGGPTALACDFVMDCE